MIIEGLWKAILLLVVGIGMFFSPKYVRRYRLWELFDKIEEPGQVEILLSKTIGIIFVAIGIFMLFRMLS